MKPPNCWRPVTFSSFAILLIMLVRSTYGNLNEHSSHSRQKRFLWLTEDGRLTLPPGTSLTISPSLSLPFVRHPPSGFLSNMTISIPLTIDFDKLGLTDEENPFGALPPIFSRSMGRAAGNYLADFIGDFVNRRRDKRDLHTKENHKHLLAGGERAVLYVFIEDFLENLGMDGKACLLRAICEAHSQKLTKYGLLGEVFKLLLTASSSPFADLLGEYTEAENAGNGGKSGPGECWPYMKKCSKSLFTSSRNLYKRKETNIEEEQPSDNEVVQSVEYPSPIRH